MHAEVVVKSVFHLTAEVLKEFFIAFPVVFHEFDQLALDLLFQVPGDVSQLTVLLKGLTGDVQGQILRVDKSFDEVEVVWQQFLAFVHDHDTGGVELQTFFIVLGIVIEWYVARDEQKGSVAGHTFHTCSDHLARIHVVTEFALVIFIVVFVLDLALLAFPYWFHGVESLKLLI